MAKLLLNPDDAEARQFMNDERSPKEHYHFAAINWARFLPVFGSALTPETKHTLAAEAGKYSAYLNLGGTENHKMMNLCAAAVLPEYLEGGRIANKDKEAALREAKDMLRAYVKGLYAAGQGEWDSPTYLMFDLHGFLNIYDFSSDPEMRLIAAAARDCAGPCPDRAISVLASRIMMSTCAAPSRPSRWKLKSVVISPA